MTQFDQSWQTVWGSQQNAGGDIINNLSPREAWKPPLMLPPRAPSFVGREEDLAWVLHHLRHETGITVALCGPGGMGKTALAAEALAHLRKQEDWETRFPDGIFYHSFYTYPSLDIACEELARTFGEDPGADPRLAARRALSRRRAVLVFDGVEHLEDSRPLRELGGRNVVPLLSRRRSDAPDQSHLRDLETLTSEQAKALLETLAGPRADDRQSVQQLVGHIGGYPLALQLIGSYLSSQQEEVGDYLRWLEQEGLTAIHFGEHQDQSIPLLLQRTYNALPPQAQQVFTLFGFFALAPVPVSLVQEVLDVPEQTVRHACGRLVNLSVFRRPYAAYEVSHPLIHAFARELLLRPASLDTSPVSGLLPQWEKRFLDALAIPIDQSNPYDMAAFALWSPHVFSLLGNDAFTTTHSLKRAGLFATTGFVAGAQGKYGEAEPLLQRALAIREEQLGPTHPDTVTSLSNLAYLYHAQGKYGEAEPLYQRVLAICEEQLGLTHPDTATSLNNLAGLYQAQGKYTEAEPLYQRALAIYEERLGPTHPDIATSLNNLAGLYQAQGKYGEAEPLLQRALIICKAQLGPDHPTTQEIEGNFLILLAARYTGGDLEALLQLLSQRENPDGTGSIILTLSDFL
jgi:tetratricopeptide (TPR) repeat protein